MRRTIRWRSLAWTGWEHVDIHVGPNKVSAKGVLIGDREGRAYGAMYELTLAPDWTFRHILISRTDGETLDLRKENNDEAWTLNGADEPSLDSCIDIDLSGSPLTNTLPVRRIPMDVRQPKEFSMAWIPLDTFEPFADRQNYTRLSDSVFHYQSGDFEREITFDDDGFVVDYPGLFERID